MWARSSMLVVVLAGAGQAQEWRSLDVSRQLRDSSEHRVRVRYSVGRFTLRPTSDPVLFSMQLRYDEERARPLHSYDAESRSLTIGTDNRQVRFARRVDGNHAGDMHLVLSNAVPFDLDVELGAAEARLDAGGLMLERLRVRSGATDAVLNFSAPNRARMRRLDIELGAAGFSVKNLANANVSAIRVGGGVGDIDLDFGGSIKEDVTIDAQVALGKLSLHLPRDVGIRVEVQKLLASFDHPGLYKRGNAYYSDNWDDAKIRMRVKAETVFGAIEVERDR